MSDQKISQLADAGAPQDTDQLVLARSGTTLSLLWSSVKTALNSLYVPLARTITAGTGLTGGGDLSANRTLTVAYGSTSTTACVGNDSRLSDSRAPNGSAGGDLSGSYPNPTLVSRVVDYVQITANVTVTASTEGTAQTVVSGAGFTADGSSEYLIEFWSPSVRPGTTSGNSIFLVLQEGSTVIGTLSQMRQPATGLGFNLPCYLAYRLVPTAASHTYTITSYVTASTSGLVGAGSGGSGVQLLPAYIMVTKQG